MVEKIAGYEFQLDEEFDERIHGRRLNVHDITRSTKFQTLSYDWLMLPGFVLQNWTLKRGKNQRFQVFKSQVDRSLGFFFKFC